MVRILVSPNKCSHPYPCCSDPSMVREHSSSLYLVQSLTLQGQPHDDKIERFLMNTSNPGLFYDIHVYIYIMYDSDTHQHYFRVYTCVNQQGK